MAKGYAEGPAAEEAERRREELERGPQEPEADPPVEHIVVPPMYTGTCIDQSDPVPF